MGNNLSCCLAAPGADGKSKREALYVTKPGKDDGKSAAAEGPAKPEIDSTAIPSSMVLNILDPENGPAAGMPYQVHYLGPPRPPCEADRADTVDALNCISGSAYNQGTEDPEITSILKLTKSMFKAPVALVALFDDKRVFVAEEDGGVIPRGDFPWRWTLCAWSLAYNNPQILVIPDTLLDARFRENQKVTCFPKVRFYCGAPLVASNGHRLGTLCFADVEPRPGFDAASCSVMNNLSELVVRHLEKDIALKLKQRDNEALAKTYGHLQRTLDCFEHCVVLLDTSVEGWQVLHANASLTKLTGLERGAVIGKPLSDVFEGFQGMALPNPELTKAAQQCLDFQVTSASIRKAFLATEGAGKDVGARPFVLTFRPAAREGLDDSVVPIGIPAFLKANTTLASGASQSTSSAFYFMTVDVLRPENLPGAGGNKAGGGRRASTASSMFGFSTSSNSSASTVDGLELGHLLGKGSFGSVYYGSWMGTPVAVKVIDHEAGTAAALDGAALEAVLGKELRHPNVVQTLKYAHKKLVRSNAGTTSISLNSSSTLAASGPQFQGWSKTPKMVMEEEGEDGISEGNNAGTGTGTGAASDVTADAIKLANNSNTSAAPSSPWPVINLVDTNASAEWPAGDTANNSGANANSAAANKAGGAVSKDANAKSGALVSSTPTSGACASDSTVGNGVTTQGQTWLLLEYCDKGCLQEAIDRGWLRTERSALAGGPNMLAVVATAMEVACALAYLHSNNVVHGDLSSWNVMLCSSGARADVGGRNFIAKVGDFGLARTLEVRSRIQTRTYGTLTHMPPETLKSGIVSKAVDVYAMGVLLWQMYTSSRPWSGLTHSQIIMLVTGGSKLVFPDDTPSAYKALALRCMATSADERPCMEEVVKALTAIIDNAYMPESW